MDLEIVPDRIRTSIQQVLERSGKQSELWKRGSGRLGDGARAARGRPGRRFGQEKRTPDRTALSPVIRCCCGEKRSEASILNERLSVRQVVGRKS